jgi:hypothetical protein
VEETYVLAALAVFPLLVTHDGSTALLGNDTFVLLERRAQRTGSNLGGFVEPAGGRRVGVYVQS